MSPDVLNISIIVSSSPALLNLVIVQLQVVEKDSRITVLCKTWRELHRCQRLDQTMAGTYHIAGVALIIGRSAKCPGKRKVVYLCKKTKNEMPIGIARFRVFGAAWRADAAPDDLRQPSQPAAP